VPGEGTTFIVRLATGPIGGAPLREKQADGPTAALAQSDRSQFENRLRCDVLLAEDSPDSQRLISLVLKQAGAEVTLAENGLIALEMAIPTIDRRANRRCGDDSEPFDVILMDMNSPLRRIAREMTRHDSHRS